MEDLDQLTVDDARSWWTTYARPDLCTLVFAGDIDLAEAGTLAKKYLVGWSAEGSAPPMVPPPLPEKTPTHVYLVDHDGVQSEIRVGHLSFTRQDPDYFVSRVVSGYFGGAFSSRLNETIRVEKGLTYGARGGFSSQKMSGTFLVSTFSKNATTVEAVEAILQEIRRLQDEAPSASELNNTVSYVNGSYPASRETPQQVASEIWSQRLLGLPDDFTQKLLAAVASTTAEECLRVAKSRVHPDSLSIVVVGPAKELKEGLEKLAPLTVIDR